MLALQEPYLPAKLIIIWANEQGKKTHTQKKPSLIEDKQLRKHHRSLQNNCLKIGVIIIY